MREGKSGGGTITVFDASDQETRIACEVKGFDPLLYIDRKEVRRNDRFVHYAMAASKQALADAEFTIDEENAEDVGVIIGSGIGGLTACHDQFKVLFDRGPDRVSPFFITMFITDIAAGFISMQTGAGDRTSLRCPPAPPAPMQSVRRRRSSAVAMPSP